VKLLLLLPLILGLASFKKFLGLLAIIIPGLIGFLKFYKPYPNYYSPVYTKNGVAQPSYESQSNFDYHGNYENIDFYGHDLAYRIYCAIKKKRNRLWSLVKFLVTKFIYIENVYSNYI